MDVTWLCGRCGVMSLWVYMIDTLRKAITDLMVMKRRGYTLTVIKPLTATVQIKKSRSPLCFWPSASPVNCHLCRVHR